MMAVRSVRWRAAALGLATAEQVEPVPAVGLGRATACAALCRRSIGLATVNSSGHPMRRASSIEGTSGFANLTVRKLDGQIEWTGAASSADESGVRDMTRLLWCVLVLNASVIQSRYL
jgi:hypothetical protein